MAIAPQQHPRRLARATDSLRPLQLSGVRDTGVKVGDGSYATVKQLDFRGLKCVGKKIHARVYELANEQDKREIVERFTSECELLARLHHPCIVQFLGVYFEEGSQLPVMVMEYLYTTLAECLDKYGVLPEEIMYGVLRDVALGLRYLHEHSPPIIHRDISANNVLLATDMSAKISDLGVAKILNLSPAQITQQITTQAPGTPCYMPPEALVSKPSYTSKIDSYSYGVLMIHVLCGEWPFPGDAFTEAPNSPGSFLPVSEFDRRREHLLKIGLDHPLMGLIRQCLSNAPASRPEASDILGRIEDLKSSLPASFENKLEMILLHSKVTTGEQSSKERPPKDDRGESELRQMIETLRDENETQRNLIETLKRENEAQMDDLESKTREVASQNDEILSLREQLQRISIPLPSTSAMPSPPLIQTSRITPDTPVKWKRCADLPVGMCQPRSVFIEGMVYVGGGSTSRSLNYTPEDFLVFQYDPRRDVWATLPPCHVRWFTLSEYQGYLISVGGLNAHAGASRWVYRYKEETCKWETYLKPMPTPRFEVSVVTTRSAIVACAGLVDLGNNCATVEVYLAETGQWHTANPLPNPYSNMTSLVINDTCYLLGGYTKYRRNNTVFHAHMSSLIDSAMLPLGRFAKAFKKSVWKTLPDMGKQIYSTAASLSGRLLTIGGNQNTHHTAVHVFVPANNTWVRMSSGDLPYPVNLAAAVELPGKRLMVCGGETDGEFTKATFMGSCV